MKCKYCGATIPPGAVFCTSCGEMVEQREDIPVPPRPAPVKPVKSKRKTSSYILLACIVAIAAFVLVALISRGGHNILDTGTAVEYRDQYETADTEDSENTDGSDGKTAYNWKDAVYIFPDSNTRPLTAADLEDREWEEITMGRNEIFARHGRMFKTPEIAEYFNSKSWYNGTISPDSFNADVLSQVEKDNVKFLQEYENQHFGGSYY